jgi:hypothetical protein
MIFGASTAASSPGRKLPIRGGARKDTRVRCFQTRAPGRTPRRVGGRNPAVGDPLDLSPTKRSSEHRQGPSGDLGDAFADEGGRREVLRAPVLGGRPDDAEATDGLGLDQMSKWRVPSTSSLWNSPDPLSSVSGSPKGLQVELLRRAGSDEMTAMLDELDFHGAYFRSERRNLANASGDLWPISSSANGRSHRTPRATDRTRSRRSSADPRRAGTASGTPRGVADRGPAATSRRRRG